MEIETCIIDAFTRTPFRGNPAGVCMTKQALNTALMQDIAAELNVSETAFLTPSDSEAYYVRYFSPLVEVPFCGHASFASAKFLMALRGHENVELITGSGLRLTGLKRSDKIAMKFPNYHSEEIAANSKLLDAIGIKSHLCIMLAKQLQMLVVEIDSKEELMALAPDFKKMQEADTGLKQVVVTARGDKNYDFYSRSFCPWIGIDEDPVTGAAHCVLAPYWQQKLQKSNFLAYQCSKRGGDMELHILDTKHVEVIGEARIILKGNIVLGDD